MKNMNLEEIIADYFFKLVAKAFSKVIKPDMKFEDVTSITEEYLTLLKHQYGIEGLIVDVDDTLRVYGNEIGPECCEWIDLIKKYFKIIIVSNGIDPKIQEYFEQLQIDYIGFAGKPLPFSFKKALKKLDLKPEQVAVIGDNMFADIYGGKKHNMTTIMVNERSKHIKVKK